MRPHTELLAAVDRYGRALHACDVDLLDEVFHPTASLFDVDGGTVTTDPYPDWRRVVASRRSPADAGQPRWDEVVAVQWLSDEAATVSLRLRILDEVFVDHLCLVRDGARFRVVAKVWHLERVEPADDRSASPVADPTPP